MNYYYDIILNWCERVLYDFYEWNDTDYLELIKKIPFFKVKHKVLIDFLSCDFKVDSEFLNLIKDRTLVSGKNLINRITYAALFTDNKNVIAIEFNKDGLSITRSNLLIDDELNVLESTFNIKETNINYEIVSALEKETTLRQVTDAKRLITLEINNLYQNKELSKLRYLYYEYKSKKCEDLEEIYRTFLNDINTNFNQDLLKLYYIIKLSYHKV